jgi:[ribosomal protein S5]-alanine N-acetyltransferase
MQPVLIETKRLTLKGFTPQDMTFIFEQYAKDEIKKILGHRTEEAYEKEALKQKNGYATYNRTFLLFLLIEKTTDRIIGRCGLHNWNVEHKRAEIGYDIGDENFKRMGLMSEAVSAIIDYGFNTLNLHRIEAMVGSRNTPSLKIMEKFNFVREGLLRQHYYIDGKYEDSIFFSKLRVEYLDQ